MQFMFTDPAINRRITTDVILYAEFLMQIRAFRMLSLDQKVV